MTICNGSPASQGLYYAKILGEIDGIVIGVQILDSINTPQKKIGDNRPIVKLAITGIRYTRKIYVIICHPRSSKINRQSVKIPLS